MRTLVRRLIKGSLLIFLAFALLGADHEQGSSKEADFRKPCGGADNIPCKATLYCQFPDGSCGEKGESGLCEKKPEICMTLYMPVCGCDGKTYSNGCKAASAGVSVRKSGACS